MSRTTIVNFPDGTSEKRTSKSRVYTHAVLATVDNAAWQQSCLERADYLEQVLARVREIMASGDLSVLERKLTSTNGRGEKFHSSYLPGDADGGYWLPDHLTNWHEWIDKALDRIAKNVEHERARAAQLAAGPRVSYHVARWSSRPDLAAKACGEFKGAHVVYTAVECAEL